MLRIRGHLKHSYAGSMIVKPHKPHEAICLKPPLDVCQSPPGLFDRETQISDISRLQTPENRTSGHRGHARRGGGQLRGQGPRGARPASGCAGGAGLRGLAAGAVLCSRRREGTADSHSHYAFK